MCFLTETLIQNYSEIWVIAADSVSVNVVNEHIVGLSPPDCNDHKTNIKIDLFM